MIWESGARETESASADAALVEAARGAPAAYYQFRLSASGEHSITFVSSAFSERFGFEPGSPEESIAAYLSRVHPDDLPGLKEAIARSARTLKTLEVELRFRLPSGGEIWVEVRANPRSTEDAGVLWNGIATDITSRKRAEEALRESEFRFRTLFQTSTYGVVSQDKEGKIVMVNRAAERILGVEGRDIRALTSDDKRWQSVNEDGSPAVGETHPASVALRTGKPVSGVVMGAWNPVRGERVWLRTSAVPEFRAGEAGPSGVWVTFEDITESKKAAQALEASETRYRALFESAAEGIIAIDPETKQIQFFNPALCAMFGYTPLEFASVTIADLHPKEALPKVHEQILATAAGMPPAQSSVPCLRKDGTTFTADVRGSVFELEGRKFVFGLFTDVTERARLEEKLRHAQRMDAIGQLAGGVAHDFNNLLTVIIGNTELLLLDKGPEDPERATLIDIRRASERAASLTHQLLAFSRKQILEPSLVDVHVVVARIEKTLRPLIGEEIEVVTELAASESWVKVDPGQFELVVMNLALNALDAMPRGGRITFRTGNLDAVTSTDPEEAAGQHSRPKVALSIADTGTGIPPELKAHLFEPFFTTKAFGKGSGLGLATVHGIVKQSGGDITVESEPGKGATFTVVLSSRSAPQPRSGSSASRKPLPRGTETVLVVEDEDAVRHIVKVTLESTGYRVIEARSGLDAIEVVRRHPERIHLVVTDVVLPELGGRELGERLVKDHPGVRILYMSGYTNDAVTRHGILESGVAFLEKPFSPLVLARKVREVLDAPEGGSAA